MFTGCGGAYRTHSRVHRHKVLKSSCNRNADISCAYRRAYADRDSFPLIRRSLFSSNRSPQTIELDEPSTRFSIRPSASLYLPLSSFQAQSIVKASDALSNRSTTIVLREIFLANDPISFYDDSLEIEPVYNFHRVSRISFCLLFNSRHHVFLSFLPFFLVAVGYHYSRVTRAP